MHLDVVDLKAFYATDLGAVVRRTIAHRIRGNWRKIERDSVIGLGFTTPYLGSFRGEAARLGAFMPASQGALVWPSGSAGHSVMVDPHQLPLADNSVDRLLAIHYLEFSESARPVLREMWRVLAPEGRLLLVVPNRAGVWSRRETTPFGHGQPYSRAQLERLLSEALFSPLAWATALHVPPVDSRWLLRSAGAIERLGNRFWPRFAGVIMVEASKEMVAPIGKSAAVRSARALTPAEAGGLNNRRTGKNRDPVR
jgi:SAM-dependent methyltransferase